MNNQLVKIDPLPFSEIQTISKAFFESGMFTDAKSAAVAIVKIQAGQELGVPPFAAMTGIHIIQGRPTLAAGLIAGRVKGSGKYDYKVVKHDKTICKLEFFEGGKSLGVSTFTADDARRNGTKNMDKFPENMLFARAMSNGAKWFTPDVFAGPVYTPEDFDDTTPQTTEEAKPGDVTVLPTTTPVTQQAIKENNTPAPVVTPAAEVIKDDLTEAHANWSAVIDAIKNKGYSIESVERKYTLSAEVKAALAALVPAKPAAPVTPAATTSGKKPF